MLQHYNPLATLLTQLTKELVLSAALLLVVAACSTTVIYGSSLLSRLKIRIDARSRRFSSPESWNARWNNYILPPCEEVILQAKLKNQEEGHENLGALSLECGFSLTKGTLLALPESHTAWDHFATQLPHLIKTQTLREAADRLPVLNADRQSLSDKYLHRAATILGVVAHSYMRSVGEFNLTVKYNTHDEVLPASIHQPWAQVSKRLGRRDSTMTYVDLVLYNFKTSAKTFDQMELANSDLLIPTVDNQSEKVFYGIMVEMNAKTIPVLRDVVEAQRSVLMEDTRLLKQAIRDTTRHVQDIMICLSKLHACPSKKYFVDPVVWAQTVANLAIPWLHTSVGFAGTAHPFFQMMDEFIGRHQYHTKLGKEALKTRAYYPQHWQQFLLAVREVSVDAFVRGSIDPELKELWQSMKNMYIGDEGLLGYHRRKAYGFLMVGFRLGRVSTINGLGQKSNIQMWEEVDEELEGARSERPNAGTAHRKVSTQSSRISHDGSKKYTPHELMQHNNAQRGYWFAAQGKIYDATNFMRSHPGGERTITLVSGQVATKDLAAVAHLTDPKIGALMDKHEIGLISYRHFSSARIRSAYAGIVSLGYKLAEIEGIYSITMTFLDSEMTSADLPQELNAHKARHFFKSKLQLQESYANAIALSVEQIVSALSELEPDQSCNVFDATFIDKIRSRAEKKGSINLDVNNLPSWDMAQTDVLKNRNMLAAIKAVCIDVLIVFENLDADAELDKAMYGSTMASLQHIVQLANQLGQ